MIIIQILLYIHNDFLRLIKKDNILKDNNNSKYTTSLVQDRIIFLMKKNPYITTEEINCIISDLTIDGIKYHIKKLKENNIISRSGSRRSGRWIVL